MLVGVPKEIKPQEYRVGLTPAAVREYVAAGHDVIVESGAGEGIHADDATYEAGGGRTGALAERDQPVKSGGKGVELRIGQGRPPVAGARHPVAARLRQNRAGWRPRSAIMPDVANGPFREASPHGRGLPPGGGFGPPRSAGPGAPGPATGFICNGPHDSYSPRRFPGSKRMTGARGDFLRCGPYKRS